MVHVDDFNDNIVITVSQMLIEEHNLICFHL